MHFGFLFAFVNLSFYGMIECPHFPSKYFLALLKEMS
jgi:hypothetical protein